MPSIMQTIGEKAYYKCEGIRTLDLGGTQTIGQYSFYGCTKLQNIVLPDTVKTVEKSAFYKCAEVKEITFGAGLETIGDYAFYGLSDLRDLQIPTGVAIGNYAFKGAEKLTSVLIKSEVETLGAHTLYGNNGLTIYTDATSVDEAGWNKRWNSSYRPVVWGCVLSEDGSYVDSVTITETTLENIMAKGGFTAPIKAGEVFKGWALSKDATEAVYSASQITEVPVGTTLYALWDKFTPTLHFIHNVEGCELSEKQVEYGTCVTIDEELVTSAVGYVFVGFYSDADMIIPFDFTAPVTRDMEVYVKWEQENAEGDNGDEEEVE